MTSWCRLPRRARLAARLACAAAAALLPAGRALAVISLTAGPDQQGVIINTLLGADTFYNNNWFGQNAVVANIEGGAVWNGHETTTQVKTYLANPTIQNTMLGQFDYHATAVGMTIAGQGQYYYYQAGIAPLAQLWSGSIATQFGGDGSFATTDASFTYPYVQAMKVGRDVDYPFFGGTITIHRTADVINSSWGFEDPTGSAFEPVVIDGLVSQYHTTFVVAAGNSGPGNNTVGAPASGYNKIAVAALASDNTATPYLTTADFSSRGLNDFRNPRTGQVVPNVRAAVDIAAPGDNLTVAYYGGSTGYNANVADTTAGATNLYWTNAAGTSFAAPIVAGVAGLLADVGNGSIGGNSTDGRVIKAVLLNSADKTPGWNNAQAVGADGVIRTTQSLDATVGAGRVNAARAYGQFTSGTVDVPGTGGGHVMPTGWDFGHVAAGAPNDYVIDQTLTGGQTFTATLTWFVHRTFVDASAAGDGSAGGSATDDRFDNLDLQVWMLGTAGAAMTEVAESSSLFNNVEQLSFALPVDAQYMVRVLWAGRIYDMEGAGVTAPVSPNEEDFALAWSNVPVPEPATLVLLPGCLLLLTRRPRRRPSGGRSRAR